MSIKLEMAGMLLDLAINDGEEPRKVTFALFMFEMPSEEKGEGKIYYQSNTDRAAAVEALRQWLAANEGRVHESPSGKQ